MTSSFERDLSRGETSAPHHEGAESAPTAQGLTPQLKAMDYGEAVQFLAPGGAADVARRPSPALAGPVQFAGKAGEFKTDQSLQDHFDKHVTKQGDAGGSYADFAAYEAAAMAIVKGDHTESGTKGAKTYYWKASTSQFVVVKDGFILTLFVPSAGKAYYDKQLV